MAINGTIASGQEAVSLEIRVPQKTLIQLQRTLDKVDPKLRKTLARDLRSALQGPAGNIVGDFPSEAPMSGMVPRWGRVKSQIRTNPGVKNGRAIATIGIAGEDRGFNRTVAIVERAGSRSAGLTPHGRTMTSVLQERFPLVGRGGRFVWKSWLKHRPEAIRAAILIINKFVIQYNKGVG